jgi:catechol 2,3-dioxygenase-like lactoylglutathione lyase family enzyme
MPVWQAGAVLTDARIVAFAASTDLDRAYRFYVEVLGLKLLERSPYGLELECNGSELRVNAVDDKPLVPYTVLGWTVGSLDDNVAALRAKGVTFKRYEGLDQDEYDAWAAPDGTRVVWFTDPDDNLLSLHQH